MFDYVNRLQLALGDKARRAGMKAGAGVALLIGAGFLLAALWSWLAWQLDLGPTYASLIIGGVFALIGLIVWASGSKERHAVPSTDDLRSEVETRLSLAADAAIDKVKFRRMVVPGDVLELHVTVKRGGGKIWKFEGKAMVDGQLCASAEYTAMMARKDG